MAAFDKPYEEEDTNSVGFLAYPETVGVRYKGDMRIQARTDSSFSRRAMSVLEKLIGWLPGNLAIKSKVQCIWTCRVQFGGDVHKDLCQGERVARY